MIDRLQSQGAFLFHVAVIRGNEAKYENDGESWDRERVLRILVLW